MTMKMTSMKYWNMKYTMYIYDKAVSIVKTEIAFKFVKKYSLKYIYVALMHYKIQY